MLGIYVPAWGTNNGMWQNFSGKFVCLFSSWNICGTFGHLSHL